MFTGIIEAIGTIDSIKIDGVDAKIAISSGALSLDDVNNGDSIAVNGICLTVVEHNSLHSNGRFVADVSAETLSKTNLGQKNSGDKVNLEKALTPTSRMGGHIVSGHVDGLGMVTERYQDGRSIKFKIKVGKEIAHYIASKGSITINGISLTVNEVEGEVFSINIIPQTLQETTLNETKVGDSVNLEVDIIARYLERLLQKEVVSGNAESNISQSFLAENGFLK